MYRYFKNLNEKSYCAFSGACTIHPTTSAMNSVLNIIISEISFYLVKMKEFGYINKNVTSQTIDALSIFLINTSVNEKKYLDLIKKLNTIKEDVKNDYIKYSKDRNLPCETINNSVVINEDVTVSALINFAQNYNFKEDKTKHSLFELVTIYAKICAVNMVKIKRYEPDFDIYDYDVLRFLALTNSYSIRNEKIIRRINEFSAVSNKIRKKYFEVTEKRYGKKQAAKIFTGEYKGHSILVSGNDLIELEKLLNAIEEVKADISVYTNGALFLAHFHPFFKNNPILKGHWGSDDVQYDFSIFPGAILITQNFLQKIDSLYKGEIYSNKKLSFSKVIDIKEENYMPLIETASKLQGFCKDNILKTYNIKYHFEKIQNIIENFKDKEIVLIAGSIDNENTLDEYKDKHIVYFNCPLETDILIDSIEKLKKKNVKTTVFFPQCNLESLNTILSCLDNEIEIYMANCSNILINPHVLEALCDNFKVKMLT